MSTLHTFITSAVLSPFRCFPQSDGSYTLIPNPTQDCFTDSWKKWIPVIVLGFLYLIVAPLGLVWIFSMYPKNMNNQKWRCRYVHLIQPYKHQFFGWEVVFVIQKTILVVIVDVSNGLPTSLRVFLLEIVLIAFYAIEDRVRPFKRSGISEIASHSYGFFHRVIFLLMFLRWQLFKMFILLCGVLVFADKNDTDSSQMKFANFMIILWFSICMGLSVVSVIRVHFAARKNRKKHGYTEDPVF
jgi:hypothetical protein